MDMVERCFLVGAMTCLLMMIGLLVPPCLRRLRRGLGLGCNAIGLLRRPPLRPGLGLGGNALSLLRRPRLRRLRLALGLGGGLQAWHSPPQWQAVRAQLDASPDTARVLVLPWQPFRTFAWSGGAGGAHAVMVLSFDATEDRTLLEISGSEATIQMPNPMGFGTHVVRRRLDEPARAEMLPVPNADYGRGVGALDTGRALRSGQSPRTHAALALHVLDALSAAEQSAAKGRPVDVSSKPPEIPLLPESWNAFSSSLG